MIFPSCCSVRLHLWVPCNGDREKISHNKLLKEDVSGIRAKMQSVRAAVISYYKLFIIFLFFLPRTSIILIKSNTEDERLVKGKAHFIFL